MRHAHLVADVRTAESALMARLSDGALMQRAAAGLAAHCAAVLPRVYGSRVVLLVGSGDNGGDALYAGARLATRGADVSALLLEPERAHAAGVAAFRRAGGTVVADRGVLAGADLVIDGILGIGGHGGLRDDAADIASEVARGDAVVVAVDVPSGVDADTGEVQGTAVRADVTVTFGTHKAGLLVDPGASYAGFVQLVDIGLTTAGPLPTPALEALQSEDVYRLLPRPTASSDKYSRGVVGVLAGSDRYSGAAVLAVGGALRGGAGMVRAVTEPAVAHVVRAAWPEAVVTELDRSGGDPRNAGRVQAWVVGPGGGTDEMARSRLEAVLDTDLPVLIDADGLTMLAAIGALPSGGRPRTLLTPHAGELARLLDMDRSDVEAARLDSVRRAADTLGATVLLKGSTTLVAAPGDDHPVRVNPTGTPWLAAAGTGDVLAGLAGALLAGGLSPLDAGSVAAYLHGLAARISADAGPPTATDVLAALSRARAQVDATPKA